MSIIVIEIDLAKSIFTVHGVNEVGKAELVKPRVSREQLLPLIAQLPTLPAWQGGKLRHPPLGASVQTARRRG